MELLHTVELSIWQRIANEVATPFHALKPVLLHLSSAVAIQLIQLVPHLVELRVILKDFDEPVTPHFATLAASLKVLVFRYVCKMETLEMNDLMPLKALVHLTELQIPPRLMGKDGAEKLEFTHIDEFEELVGKMRHLRIFTLRVIGGVPSQFLVVLSKRCACLEECELDVPLDLVKLCEEAPEPLKLPCLRSLVVKSLKSPSLDPLIHKYVYCLARFGRQYALTQYRYIGR